MQLFFEGIFRRKSYFIVNCFIEIELSFDILFKSPHIKINIELFARYNMPVGSISAERGLISRTAADNRAYNMPNSMP